MVIQQVSEQSTQEQRVTEFAQHVDESNVDFKETIMKKVHTLKLKDTAELNHRVRTKKIIRIYIKQTMQFHNEKIFTNILLLTHFLQFNIISNKEFLILFIG